MKIIVLTLALFAVAYAGDDYETNTTEPPGYENNSEDNGEAEKGSELDVGLDTSSVRKIRSNAGFRFVRDNKGFAGKLDYESGSARGSGGAGFGFSMSSGAGGSGGMGGGFGAGSSASGSEGKFGMSVGAGQAGSGWSAGV